MKFLLRLAAFVFAISGPAHAQLMDVDKVQSGVWEGYCSTYGRCAAGINTAYFTAKVGPLNFKPTFNLVYESKGDRFKLSMSMFYTPPGFKVDLRKSYVLLPNGKVRFKEQRHSDAGRGRNSSNIAAPIRRKDRKIKDIMSYLARAERLRVHLAYTFNGNRYEGPIDFSLNGSSKVLTTVYGQFDEPGRTFQAGKKVGAKRPVQVTWEKRSCNKGMFNWCVFTDNPEGTAALATLGLLTGKALQAMAPMAEQGARIVGTYSCTLTCVQGFDDRDTKISLKNINANQAYDYMALNSNKICRSTFGVGFSPTFIGPYSCDLK